SRLGGESWESYVSQPVRQRVLDGRLQRHHPPLVQATANALSSNIAGFMATCWSWPDCLVSPVHSASPSGHLAVPSFSPVSRHRAMLASSVAGAAASVNTGTSSRSNPRRFFGLRPESF